MKANLEAVERELGRRGDLWPASLVATVAGLHRSRLYDLASRGHVPFVMVCGYRFVSVRQLLSHYRG